MKKRLVIFDLDGLLIDSERLYHETWRATFIENGHHLSEEQESKIIGMGFNDTRDHINRVIDPGAFDRLRPLREVKFWTLIEELGNIAKPGAKQLLDDLAQRNIRTAIATSTAKDRAYKLLSYTDFNHVFDYGMFGDKIKHTKPHPEIFLKVLEQAGMSAHEALVLEDSYSGVKAANQAGIDVLWVKDMQDLSHKQDISYQGSFDNLDECAEYVKTLL